jgi:hypothetical protein
MGRARAESWSQRLARLAQRYLTAAHRDDPADGCALAALASEAARASPEFRRVYEDELNRSLRAICDLPDGSTAELQQFDEAIVLMALAIGGISLARAVEQDALSDRILAVCRNAATRIAVDEDQPADTQGRPAGVGTKEKPVQSAPDLDQFPSRTYEKLRYADTDRQGHINNAVFATMLETGRVEVLYNPSQPLTSAERCVATASTV